MPEPILCARCGAPLALPSDPAARDVLCTFCHTRTPLSVAPRETLREGSVPSAGGSKAVLVIALGVALLGAGFAMLAAARRPAPASTLPSSGAAAPGAAATSAPRVARVDAGAPGLGKLVGTFGGKGTAPGLFTDARVLAVDPDGDVYVGEYDSGHVHQFDATGKFLQTIRVPPSKDGRSYLFGLAADWAGALYVSRAHEVVKMSRKDFSVLWTVPERGRPDRKRYVPGEDCAHALAVDPSGAVYVLSDCTPEGMSFDIDNPLSLLKLDPRGKTTADWRDAGGERLAVDGAGTVVIAQRRPDAISVWDPSGKLVTRWGQEGKDPGDFGSPLSDVAVDGRGHVLVLSWSSLDAYDLRGKYRGRVAGKGGRALAVGPTGDAFVLDDDVKRYALSLPE